MKLPLLISFLICNLILLTLCALAGDTTLAYTVAAGTFVVQAGILLWTHKRVGTLVAQLVQVFDSVGSNTFDRSVAHDALIDLEQLKQSLDKMESALKGRLSQDEAMVALICVNLAYLAITRLRSLARLTAVQGTLLAVVPLLFPDTASHGGAPGVLEAVDLFIPGCPPHPLTILDGLLRLLGRPTP